MKIVLSAVLVVFLIGCNDEAKTQTKSVKETTVTPVAQKIVEPKKEIAVKEVKVEKVEKKTVEKVVVSTPNGAKLFVKCSSCHGLKAEKSALSKSQIIQGWSSDKITAAINGYRDGTYGSTMKGLMKSQVKTLSPNEIKVLAEYISKLK